MSTGQHRLEELLTSPKHVEFHPVLFPLVSFFHNVGFYGNLGIVAASLALMGATLMWLEVGVLGCVFALTLFVFALLGCGAVYENVATKVEHVSGTLLEHIRERNTWLSKSRHTKDKELSQRLAPFLTGCGGKFQGSWFEGVARALDVRHAEIQHEKLKNKKNNKKTTGKHSTLLSI